MKVIPICRYGHGPLVEVAAGSDTDHWAFMGISRMQYTVGQPVGQPLTQTGPSGNVFMVKLFKCQECGYIEVFDFEDSDA